MNSFILLLPDAVDIAATAAATAVAVTVDTAHSIVRTHLKCNQFVFFWLRCNIYAVEVSVVID